MAGFIGRLVHVLGLRNGDVLDALHVLRYVLRCLNRRVRRRLLEQGSGRLNPGV